MAVKSNFRNMALGLFLTCFICSSVLGVVHAITEDPIEKAAAEKVIKAIELVLPKFDSKPEKKTIDVDGVKYTYYVVKSGNEVSGYAIETASTGFGGELSMMVGVLPTGVIYNTRVLSHSETPGLGAKCTEDEFNSQFKNLDPTKTKLAVTKDGGDIDAITASTITSRAYVKAITNAISAFKKISK